MPEHNGNLDSTTDYFIVIVGMDTDSNGKYFRFYDNASGLSSQGANSENKFYYNSSTGTIIGQSEAEKVIFDNMLPNRRMWYLATGYKAKEKATELYPNSLHNGKGDAFRHCYWNALSSKFIGVNLTNQLTTAHEDKPFTYPYEQKEKDMDLYNNNIGQNIANYVSILDNIEQEVLTLLNYGFLRYLSNLNSNSLPTYQSFLTPTNQ